MNILKITILAMALSGAIPAMAQKLEYRDFKVTTDMRARLKDTEVIDENSGKRAALLKIYTPFANEVLGFDAGLYRILGRRQAGPGEVWLYVPERTQKVTVTHPIYSPVVIWFEGMEAESGETYSVELNVEGRDVALIASTPNAEITVDGVARGKSPVNMHMPLGSHLVSARLGPLVYEDIINVRPDGEVRFDLPMEDENLKFGDVDIEVANGAELWFQDRREGIGSLHKHLRAGSYVVTSRLPDHEDATTTFTVEAGKTGKVTADAPVPHVGYVSIVTEPAHGVTVTMGDSVIDLVPTMQMPVARYELNFSRKGYYPRQLKFRTERGQTFTDTVRLQKIQYVKKTTGYVALSAMAASKMSVGFTAGAYIENVNIEASYNLGLGRTGMVKWYDSADNVQIGEYDYRVDELAVRAGYQLRFYERFGLTPQAGFMVQRLSAKDGSNPGHGYTQPCATAGLNFSFHPVPNVGFFIAPAYAVPVSGKGDIADVFSQAGLTRGGFRASVGFSVSL